MNGKLIVSEGGRDRVHELCDARTIVGRGADADLHLREEGVSPAHCEVTRIDGGFKVVDLETAEGTKVNGQFVNHHVLKNGDTIQVGSARITYLGDSAPEKKPSRAAPPPPLKVHPTNADGEPQRFYRHEQNPGLPSGAKAAIILAVISLLALILVWMGSTVPNEEGHQEYAEARALIARGERDGDPRALEKGIAILEGLPPGVVHETDLEFQIDKAKGRLLELVGDVEETKAEAEYRRIIEYWESHPDDVGYLRGQTRFFKDAYPESGLIKDLERRLTEAQSGGKEGIKRWEKAQDDLRLSLRGKDFKAAFAKLRELEADPTLSAIHSGSIATYRKTFERAFKDHFAAEKERALRAFQGGDVTRAKDIYRGLVEVGLEPYATQAKALLGKLGG